MVFTETRLKGSYIIDIEPIIDKRGFFARTWCANEFIEHGLNPGLVQCSISFNEKKGTLRGMHYQSAPHEEDKIVNCISGSIYDVIIDLRPLSETYLEYEGVELDSKNHRMMYIPKGFAHGFQTLEDNTEVFYMMSESYHPESSKGIIWNDPRLNIRWPLDVVIILEKDQSFKFIERIDDIG